MLKNITSHGRKFFDAGTGGLSAGEAYVTDGTGSSPLDVAGIVMVKQ